VTIDRKSFLWGVGGVIAGGALGVAGGRASVPETPPAPPPPPRQGEPSYAQCGEDRIVHFMLGYLGIKTMDYLDIGAYEPISINNKFLFYEIGHRGVLIEPNVSMCRKLKQVRPEDTVLEAGIGITAEREADYYVMTDASWNTFSKEEAEHQEKVSSGRIKIKEVIKMPLLNINQVMKDHFPSAPAFVSVDTQGLELAILKTIDFDRFRPKVICAETLVTGTKKMVPEVGEFMASKGYVVRGMSFVNSLFVDGKLL
jgi:FkbM family methyltransferase